MRKSLFLIIALVCILSQKLFSQHVLHVAKRQSVYLFVKGDTALIEYFIIDKPVRYVKYDTLVFQNDINMFKSDKTTMRSCDNSYIIQSTVNTDFLGLRFHLPNNKELKKYHYRYNSYLYNANTNCVNIREKLYFTSENEKVEFDKEWQELFIISGKMNRDGYQNMMEAFLLKYRVSSSCSQ